MFLADILDRKYIASQSQIKTSPLRYVQRHFFSSLFLSIYQALGIDRERRVFYGVINHCLRGLVTGTDNLLDDEYKELLPLAFPERANRVKSIMHILLFDRILEAVVDRAARQGVIARLQVEKVHRELFRALVPIGAEEAQEEGGVDDILPPAEILSSVHRYKGGKLLCLSLVAPLFLETEHRRRLQLAENGIYSIGMALQVIDDLTDFYEDLRVRHHNYLVSWVACKGSEAERKALDLALQERGGSGPAIEELFPDSLRLVLEQAVGEALKGFDLLAQAGFWLDRPGAMTLIRALFHLRGVRQLLALLPPEEAVVLSLEGSRG